MTVATRDARLDSLEEPINEIRDVAHHVPRDVALHLRVVRPAILRTYVPAADLAQYLDLATEYEYALAVDWRLATSGAVRVVFTRGDLDGPPVPRPALRPLHTTSFFA